MSLFLSRTRVKKAQDQQTARDIIAEAINTTDGIIELSNLFLFHLPKEMSDLKHIVWYSPTCGIIREIKLFLINNQLLQFPKSVLNLDNLTVLILKGNFIRFVPPQLSQLTNLVELSLSSNMIQSFPISLLELKKLEIFIGVPNPLFETKKTKDKKWYWKRYGENGLKFQEIILRQSNLLQNNKFKTMNKKIPEKLQSWFDNLIVYTCSFCLNSIYFCNYEAILFLSFCKPGLSYPFSLKFCSQTCAMNFDFIHFIQQLNPNQIRI
ncbi:hypothetical protein K502DRAFT_341470 [Neoconidiobolus thromboides FSU 785]|nr:hypothetical protein K502DRAFT_341470 [Neoconidiobolus thromboides FSU 785]